MKTIYKYSILAEEKQIVSMPVKAEILTVQAQGDNPCIWALVDDSLPLSDVLIRIYPTGVEIDQSLRLRYCDTFQMLGGNLVFHVFIEEQ